ncbi:MAG TPA: hypothetical protein VMV79_04920 [Alphaproteobacteria bacterium]|nr:hypothetical protein [Alphaproteobacteria bacterium]
MGRKIITVMIEITFVTAVIIWAVNYFFERKPPPLPQLVAGLSGDTTAQSAAFQQRVEDKFPVGTPAGDMTEELAREGFKLTDTAAIFERRILKCEDHWEIDWQASHGDVTWVNTSYYRSCL